MGFGLLRRNWEYPLLRDEKLQLGCALFPDTGTPTTILSRVSGDATCCVRSPLWRWEPHDRGTDVAMWSARATFRALEAVGSGTSLSSVQSMLRCSMQRIAFCKVAVKLSVCLPSPSISGSPPEDDGAIGDRNDRFERCLDRGLSESIHGCGP